MLPRQGWVDRGLAAPESVAEHIFRAAWMAWTLGAQAGLDTDHLLKLMLVHDLPEARAGDITPYASLVQRGHDPGDAAAHWRDLLSPAEMNASKANKLDAERSAMSELASYLGQQLGTSIAELWDEYAARLTPEARFASQVDKLEALLQAMEYEKAGAKADLESFLMSARDHVEHPVLKAFLAEIEARLLS